MVKKIVIGVLVLTGTIYADTTTVSIDSGAATVFNQGSTPLSGGTTNDGDGTVLQLGYFNMATTANNFLGTFVPLTGEGSANTAIIPGSLPPEGYNHTSIGDLNAQGGTDGTFFIPGLNFTAGDPLSGNNLPPANTPLAIVFYNGTTIGSSTFYNAVSDDLWLWKTPATPAVNVAVSLDDPGLEWLSISLGQNANSPFHTTIPTAIPEPSSLALLGLGLAAVPLARRRASGNR